jgi:hypothetical protein
MARYHINPKTGNPGICRATKVCPFGDLEADHYSTSQDARTAYEQKMSVENIPEDKPEVKVNSWEHLSNQELGQLEEDTLAEKRKTKLPYTDEEYNRHRTYIRRMRKVSDSTHKMYSRRIDGKTVYTLEREELHKKIIDQELASYAKVPNNGRAILAGGLPGSGKSTSLSLEVNQEEWAIVNPDSIKEKIIKEGEYPRIKGLLPMEHDEILMYEAQLVSDRVLERLMREKKNVIIDKTLSGYNPAAKTIGSLRGAGYSKVEVLFVDVDTDTAYDRITQRHREGLDKYVSGEDDRGSRCVPGSVLVGSTPEDPKFNSKNIETLIRLANDGLIDGDPTVYDNSGSVPEKVDYAIVSGRGQ